MKINLQEMVFYGFHGVYEEERKLGQRFIVNFSFETDQNEDDKIENLEDTIDYTKVYDIIKNVMENHKFHLLESCANTLLNTILAEFPKIMSAKVKIQKPSVAINGILKSVELEMERSRK